MLSWSLGDEQINRHHAFLMIRRPRRNHTNRVTTAHPARAQACGVRHEEHVSRQQAAERLVDIAYALTTGGTFDLRTEAEGVTVPVADEVVLRRESKSNGDRVEVEVRVSWCA
jgi:amphi-Trp domain-containing protein